MAKRKQPPGWEEELKKDVQRAFLPVMKGGAITADLISSAVAKAIRAAQADKRD